MSLEDEIASNSDLQSILERFRRGEMPDPSDARTREVLERFKQRVLDFNHDYNTLVVATVSFISVVPALLAGPGCIGTSVILHSSASCSFLSANFTSLSFSGHAT